MGAPKALLTLASEPLIVHHVRALARVCDRVAVVVGAYGEAIRDVIPSGVTIVANEAWQTTAPSDSLRVAVVTCRIVAEAVITPVDVLPPDPTTLLALCAGPAPVVPVGPSGARGHPVRVGASTLRRLSGGPVEGGLRELLHDAHLVEVDDPWVSRDFNHPDAWREARQSWVGHDRSTG